MLKYFLKKEKYFDCDLVKNSIHFFYDEIRACCSNVSGPIFYPNYSGEEVDWNYIYNKRKELFKISNKFFNRDIVPNCCKQCFELFHCLKDEPVQTFPNEIKKIYFQFHMSCNAKCSYCIFSHKDRGFRYKIMPIIDSMIEQNILSKDATVYMSGGEITISPEFENLLSTLSSYLNSKIEILTSGIKYCDSIKQAFIKNRCRLLISLDSATSETYKKIKNVDSFDDVVNNLRTYIKASDNAKNNIVLKYIIVDGVNDNKDELSKFLYLVDDLKIKTVRLDFDYSKYKFSKNACVPKLYFDLYDFFYEKAKELGLNVEHYDQIDSILDYSRKQLNV